MLSTHFTEKELLQDLLLSEKQGILNYTLDRTQSSSKDLQKVLSLCQENIFSIHNRILDAIDQRGWNTISYACSYDLILAKEKFNTLENKIH